ncbi:MAG: hypothetical protein VX609_07605 [Verrucomicrobiota bacterium]|nr:hypothetical protein [Verrucomicrobiota bacterium]
MKNILISDNIQTQDNFIIDAIYESEITNFDSADISHLKSINISDIKEVILSTLNPDIIEFIIEEFKKNKFILRTLRPLNYFSNQISKEYLISIIKINLYLSQSLSIRNLSRFILNNHLDELSRTTDSLIAIDDLDFETLKLVNKFSFIASHECEHNFNDFITSINEHYKVQNKVPDCFLDSLPVFFQSEIFIKNNTHFFDNYLFNKNLIFDDILLIFNSQLHGVLKDNAYRQDSFLFNLSILIGRSDTNLLYIESFMNLIETAPVPIKSKLYFYIYSTASIFENFKIKNFISDRIEEPKNKTEALLNSALARALELIDYSKEKSIYSQNLKHELFVAFIAYVKSFGRVSYEDNDFLLLGYLRNNMDLSEIDFPKIDS